MYTTYLQNCSEVEVPKPFSGTTNKVHFRKRDPVSLAQPFFILFPGLGDVGNPAPKSSRKMKECNEYEAIYDECLT